MKNFFEYIFNEYDKSQSYNHGTYDPWAVALAWITMFVIGFSAIVLGFCVLALIVFYPISLPIIVLLVVMFLLYKTLSYRKNS